MKLVNRSNYAITINITTEESNSFNDQTSNLTVQTQGKVNISKDIQFVQTYQ